MLATMAFALGRFPIRNYRNNIMKTKELKLSRIANSCYDDREWCLPIVTAIPEYYSLSPVTRP